MYSEISIIPSHKIDKTKWDNCIENASNGLIYASSFYLDTMADNWDALIADDYEYVMPLPWRKKFFIKYIYPPAFMQQLGIISKHDCNENITNTFIANIPGYFKYCELHLNYANKINANSYKTVNNINFIMPLSDSYNQITLGYNRSAQRNIRKAKDHGILIREDITAEEIVSIHRKRFDDNVGANEKDYVNFLHLITHLKGNNQCITIGAFNTQGNLIAGSLYFIYKNRITFILNGNSPESLTCGATHLLKDYIIQKFAASTYILDFEGSNNPSFARFYQQFGATTTENYKKIYLNRLPTIMKWIKPH